MFFFRGEMARAIVRLILRNACAAARAVEGKCKGNARAANCAVHARLKIYRASPLWILQDTFQFISNTNFNTLMGCLHLTLI